MSLINRSLLFVSPRAPLHAWISALDPEHDEKSGTTIAYLIPVLDDFDDREKILRQVWSTIFELELIALWEDESKWPAARSLELFREFFDIAYCSMVDDLCGWEIEPEELPER
jgi:hypothetical protein